MIILILGYSSYDSPSGAGPSYPSHSISHTAPASVHSHTYDIPSHVSNSYGSPIHVSEVSHSGSAVSHSGSGQGYGYSKPTYQYGGPIDGIYF